MDLRERTLAILNFEEPDEIGFYDWFWEETIERWRREGMPDECATYSSMHSHWGHGAYIEGLPLEIGIRTVTCDISPRYEKLTLDENPQKVTIRDEWGVKTQFWRRQSGMPHALESPIATLDDFKQKVEPLMDLDAPNRMASPNFLFRKDVEASISRMREKYVVALGLTGPFELVRHMMGSKVDIILVKMFRERSFISYMLNFIGDVLATTARNLIDYGVDGLFLFDDLGYKNGPFFSPSMFADLFGSVYRKIVSPYRKKHLPVMLHSCGNVLPYIPNFIEFGITALNPLEVKAGMDVIDLKERYGDRLVLVGGVDVRALEGTQKEIETEVIRKIRLAGEHGGYIIGSDHSVPPTVSYQNYMFFLSLVKKYGKYPFVR